MMKNLTEAAKAGLQVDGWLGEYNRLVYSIFLLLFIVNVYFNNGLQCRFETLHVNIN